MVPVQQRAQSPNKQAQQQGRCKEVRTFIRFPLR